VAVLVEAVDCGVVTRVFGHDPGAIDDDLRQQMTNVLCEGSGIAPRFAVWAVDSWIAILHGVQDTGREVRKRARPAREVKWSVADRHGTLEAVFSRALEIGGRSATASPEEGPVVRDD
jgi:hypothetical protein